MTKNDVFVGKGYCDQGLFVLNVSQITSEFASSSTYMIDSYGMWHARLGHVNSAYVLKLKRLGMINMHDEKIGKCEICVESKLIKKTCHSVFRESETLSLIHYDLADLKQTMSRGGKNYFVTFIDDFSRYTKVYLIKHKDEAFDMFLSYKTEVENQLNKRIKRI
uniref:Retrovirus-related Pol polyprotein from transposon TNT 1-94 n=1 Tax=Cajanus cajan TaxID=3821 RepID=A0A151S7S2_CAJCA|nr:Retrovirus-related Pol polyprotein from transposon TNT 1-94 [Cajanus cajan]